MAAVNEGSVSENDPGLVEVRSHVAETLLREALLASHPLDGFPRDLHGGLSGEALLEGRHAHDRSVDVHRPLLDLGGAELVQLVAVGLELEELPEFGNDFTGLPASLGDGTPGGSCSLSCPAGILTYGGTGLGHLASH